MKSTAEGIQRGHMLTGPLVPEGQKYLWCVSKVNGAHSVQAMTHIGGMLCEVTLQTHGIHGDSSEWNKVVFIEADLLPSTTKRGGTIVDSGYMARFQKQQEDAKSA